MNANNITTIDGQPYDPDAEPDTMRVAAGEVARIVADERRRITTTQRHLDHAQQVLRSVAECGCMVIAPIDAPLFAGLTADHRCGRGNVPAMGGAA